MSEDTGTTDQASAESGDAPATQPTTGTEAVAAAIRGDAPTSTTAADAADASHEDEPDQASDDSDFDRERAMRTISRLREIEKQHKASERLAKEQAKRLADFEQREKDAEEAKLSEQERLTRQKGELETQLAEQRKAHQDRINRYEVQIAASQHGIVDPDAAEKLLDWKSLDYDEDGRPTDLDRALKQLVKERPYLASQPAAPRPGPANPATRASSPGQRVYTTSELDDYTFYLKHRDDIQAAMREPGRPRIEA